MPKRHEALIPLTHDHHHALVHARRLIEAADSDAGQRSEAAAAFLSFYARDTLVHVHEEEEVLFPVLLERVLEPPEELVRVLIEHVRIHGLVARLRRSAEVDAPPGDLLVELGETLRSHVRLEEQRLFPLIEARADEDALGAMAFAPRNRNEEVAR